MKKIISILLLLFIFISAKSLPTNIYYPSGKLHKEYSEGKNNKILFKAYSEDGSIQSEGIYEPNSSRITRLYFDNGKIALENFDESEDKNIRRKAYYRSGKIKIISYRNCDILEKNRCITFKEFFETGKIKKVREKVEQGNSEYNLFQDTGVMISNYYESGAILSRKLFSSNDENIYEKTYYESGKLKKESQHIIFSRGESDCDVIANDGFYREFSEDGTVTKELIYKKGKVVKTVK